MVTFKKSDHQENIQHVFPTQFGCSETCMTDEADIQVPILSFDQDGKPIKDQDGHCYFDTCHCDACFEETEWMEPWEEADQEEKREVVESNTLQKVS